MRKITAVLAVSFLSAVLFTSTSLAQQVWVQQNADLHIQAPVEVTVDASKNISAMKPWTMGVQVFGYDGNFVKDSNIPLLQNVGITCLRYPGGGYADNYHWSQNAVTPTKGNPNDKRYLAPNMDFPHFMLFLEKLGATTIVGVNYGSNLQGTGPGEPKEAAAWVAYANGNPADTRVIGKDSTGYDWNTVGYWASLRAAKPLPQDDGNNFLRIAHPDSFEVAAWEIGNEVYNNGFYRRDEKGGWEEDLHAPYAATDKENAKLRAKNPKLSPATYGEGVAAFYKEMKAIDPRIRIGAALNTMPDDSEWGKDWNHEVLKAAGSSIDFAVIHWSPAVKALPPDWKYADPAEYLTAPERNFRDVLSEFIKTVQKASPGRNIGVMVAEFGLASWMKLESPQLHGLFAADTYARLTVFNTMNVTWPEVHKDPFLKEDGTPGNVYFGMAMVHRLMTFGEPMLSATSGHALLGAYAARHRDGSLGFMFINKDDKYPATVKVKVTGDNLAAKGTRWDWGPTNPPNGIMPKESAFSDGGNTFSVVVPPYSITTISLPKQ